MEPRLCSSPAVLMLCHPALSLSCGSSFCTHGFYHCFKSEPRICKADTHRITHSPSPHVVFHGVRLSGQLPKVNQSWKDLGFEALLVENDFSPGHVAPDKVYAELILQCRECFFPPKFIAHLEEFMERSLRLTSSMRAMCWEIENHKMQKNECSVHHLHYQGKKVYHALANIWCTVIWKERNAQCLFYFQVNQGKPRKDRWLLVVEWEWHFF